MSRGFELAVAAFEPEAKTWSRLRTTLSLRSHAATLFLDFWKRYLSVYSVI